MSSTNKTSNLGLNRWIGSDIPKREDFVNDNLILDSVISSHNDNSELHVTQSEKDKWNSSMEIIKYVGDGSGSRTVNLNCGFEPRFGVIFATGTFPSLHDFAHGGNYNYFAVVSSNGSTRGAALSGSTLTLTQSAVAVSTSEYQSFNESGKTYVCVVFR